MNDSAAASIIPIRWQDDGLSLLDQRRLPAGEVWLQLQDPEAVAQAITDMVVRGAPAIGITAAFGVVLAARQAWRAQAGQWRQSIVPALQVLRESRPTAVNLAWAIDRLVALFDTIDGDPEPVLLAAARQIHSEDIAANECMGALGAELIAPGSAVLTHCNAGALATGGYGTALGVIRSAWRQQRLTTVYADETLPWLQGARLTAWELLHDGIPVTLIADGAAAHIMRERNVRWVVVGSDRIAANGDVANKIGTYSLAVAARYHGVKTMVVAPTSTIDMGAESGAAIPIEERDGNELLDCSGVRMAASGADAANPVFDVTPAALVDVIVTERGVVEQPDRDRIARLMAAT